MAPFYHLRSKLFLGARPLDNHLQSNEWAPMALGITFLGWLG